MGGEVHEPFTEIIEMRKTVSIYSLSRTPYDELMWSHYGESHEGFCIEYDLERLKLEAHANWDIVNVVYSAIPPVLDFSELLEAFLKLEFRSLTRLKASEKLSENSGGLLLR